MAQNGAYRKIGNTIYLLKPRDYVVPLVHDANTNSTVQGFIQIDSNSPFLLFDRFMEDTNDPTTAAPGLYGQYENFISVQDNANNYNWSNGLVPRSAFARDRMHGYRLPEECLIDANTKLVVNLQNPAENALAGTMTVILQGYSLYPFVQ